MTFFIQPIIQLLSLEARFLSLYMIQDKHILIHDR